MFSEALLYMTAETFLFYFIFLTETFHTLIIINFGLTWLKYYCKSAYKGDACSACRKRAEEAGAEAGPLWLSWMSQPQSAGWVQVQPGKRKQEAGRRSLDSRDRRPMCRGTLCCWIHCYAVHCYWDPPAESAETEREAGK